MGNMIHLRFFVFGTALLIVLCLLLKTLASSGSQAQRTSAAHIPRKIWQKWETPVQGLGEELMRLSKSWIDMNPDHRYELLTGDSSLTYVRERYEQYPDIIEVFEQTTDGILRADLIRYLTLLSDGGVYTDIDTDCSRPIGEWIPKDLAEQTGLLLGIEYDSQGGEIRKDFNIPTQLCQWTLMARPGHPVLQHVVDRVVEKLLADVRVKDNVTSHDLLYVLETTGPRMFTRAVLESLSLQLHRRISYEDVSNLTEPTMFGDVLVLPISSFASGQDHSGSKPWGNDEQLMSHHFLGFQGWKASHAS
ncbi:hypothetical protein B0A50_02324 [Salinomyces thailandicus]|uniref:Initiation-specific alpha-1,6-mannosyltransferase n=1 Tax=Salinomyces thailandicus TaxID=706561 RepID=A0A4U0U8U0_9PEZI|nr:hypothetical protein B0A50_02324 [Salinomyces thailandica]